MRNIPEAILRLRRAAVAALAATLAAAPASTAEANGLLRPHAVVLRVTEDHLNLLLRETLRANGGPVLEGGRSSSSGHVQGLRYRASLSEPTLALEPDGLARLSFGIERADLTIEAIERKIGWQTARCEDAGVRVDPSNPLGVDLAFRFAIEEDDLELVPEDLVLAGAESLVLVKPSHCTNSILPTWLLWWLGKPHLRRQVERLDEVLLDRLRLGASKLNDGDGLLRRQWEIDGPAPGEPTRLHLLATSLSTAGRALQVTLSVVDETGLGRPRKLPEAPGWTATLADRSFVAVSPALLNGLLEAAFADRFRPPRPADGSLRKILRSEAAHALIPGLLNVERSERIQVALRFHAPPRVEFVPSTRGSAGSRAVIRLRFRGIDLELWNGENGRLRPLGVLRVDDARVGVTPYVSVLGGVSFEIVENRWSISSKGLAFNEPLVAATLQELVFSEVFETGYEPLGREGLEVGDASLAPAGFLVREGYLVIELREDAGPGALAVSQANR